MFIEEELMQQGGKHDPFLETCCSPQILIQLQKQWNFWMEFPLLARCQYFHLNIFQSLANSEPPENGDLCRYSRFLKDKQSTFLELILKL